ncbi:MAG: CHASE2 domain-containing protein, partial [Syntrophorhabdaceae bacterium]|nr:CHASE2 domain-containing protein [Syntrophorhabdaceae bacterium]
IKKHGNVFLPILIEDGKRIKYPPFHCPLEHTGHIHIEQDVDGIVRSVYHTLIVDNITIPSITSALYEFITGKSFKRERINTDQTTKIKDKILQLDRMRINYVGGHGSFDSVSFIDVIDGIYPPSFFKNRIALIGLSATGTFDFMLTPFLKDRLGMTGVEVHANILNTLILDNAIIDIQVWLRWLIAIVIGMGCFIIFMMIDEKRAAYIGLLFIVSIMAISYFLFTRLNLWSAPAIYPIIIFIIFITSYICKFDDAVKLLQETYLALESKLRWKLSEREGFHSRKGILSIFTKKGIYMQAKILTEIGRQLSFEKELSDRALMSDIQGVLIFDNKGNNIIVNDFALDIFKAIHVETTSMDGFLYKIVDHLMEKTDYETIKRTIFEENRVTYTLAINGKKKRFYKIDFSSFDVNDVSYILLLITDITRVKELELLKSHIISVVSHELKSPMTSIQGFSEILSKNLSGKMQNFAAIINRESERLVRFLNTFLDITRIEEGRQPLRIESINLINLVQEVAHALKPLGDASKIYIHTELPQSIENIMADKDLIKQCIFNLGENAIKYSPPERDVIIRLGDEKDNIKIDVIDHGYGIKEEDLGRIFDKFFRSTSEYTKNIKGSGLGLTFVKEAIELQGGKLTFTSKYGEGSTFSIIFPK